MNGGGGAYFHRFQGVAHLHGLDDAESSLVRNSRTHFRELDVYDVAKFSLRVIGDTDSDDVTLNFCPLRYEKFMSAGCRSEGVGENKSCFHANNKERFRNAHAGKAGTVK